MAGCEHCECRISGLPPAQPFPGWRSKSNDDVHDGRHTHSRSNSTTILQAARRSGFPAMPNVARQKRFRLKAF